MRRIERRTCLKCEEEKPLDRFSTFLTRHGERRYRGACFDCRNGYAFQQSAEGRAYRKAYNAKNRSRKQKRDRARRDEAKAYVDEIKARTACTDCGQRFPAVCMDFDHVRGAKSANVSGLVSQSYKLDLIKVEIAKCDVVCACCHRLRTAKRRDNLSNRKKVRARARSYPKKGDKV